MRMQPISTRRSGPPTAAPILSFSQRFASPKWIPRRSKGDPIRCIAMTPPNVVDNPVEPPVASWLGVGFLLNGSDFTRQAVQKHGHVWRFYVLGIAKIYGLAGETGLKAFYDEQNISRFPGMSANLRDAAWVLKDDSGKEHYAIPPLDTDRAWRERKLHFMAGIDTRDAVEKYLARLDQGYIDTIKGLGAKKGDEFSLWDTINSLVLGGLSKALFGYGIADYQHYNHLKGSEQEMISNIQTGYTVFDEKAGAKDKQKTAFRANVRYLHEALAQYRARPEKYPAAGLGKYLAEAQKEGLAQEDILMDMHQMICVGAYGGVTSSAGCMAYSLATHPEVRAAAKAEIDAHLGAGTPTFASLKALPYTFAVLKECLRKWPIVHIVRGQSVRDFVVEGKTVPKNSTVIAALHGTMHDKLVFNDPDKFDPDRFLPPRNEGADEVWTGYQVVFGAGESGSQHACAGRNTAMLTMFVLLVRLLQNWQWELVNPREYLVTSHFSPTPSNDLRMRRV